MNNKIRKYLKITGLTAAFVISLLLLATLIINYFFKDRLIQYVVAQINSAVEAKITIDKVDFSLWKQFPNASVQFDKVYVQSSNKFRTANLLIINDTLLIADRVYLEFNLFQLFRGQYKLKRLNIKDAYMKLKVDSNSNNFDIFKKSETPAANALDLEFNDLVFSNTFVEYADSRSSISFLGKTDQIRINGNFRTNAIDLNIESSLLVSRFNVININYLHNKHVNFACKLNVSNSIYKFSDVNFYVSGLKLLASCELNTGNKPNIRMMVNGDNLKLGSVLETLPDTIALKFNHYRGKGNCTLKLSVKGGIGARENPSVYLSFMLANGSITEKSSGIKLTDIDLNGSYSNGSNKNLQASVIKLNNYSSTLGKGSLSGSGIITNFNNVSFSGNVIAQTDLKEVKSFFKLDSLEELDGKIESTISASGKFGKLSELKLSDIQDLMFTGTIKLTDVAFKAVKSDYNFQKINGLLSLNNDIFLNNLSFYIHDNDFLVNGTLHNGIEYMLKRTDELSLNAEIKSRNLDLSKYFSKDVKQNTDEYARELLFPDNISLDVKLSVNNFILNKFNAKWLTCNLNYKPRMFVVKSLSLETLSGHVSGNGAIIQDVYKNFIIKGQSVISKIEIQKLFYTFNNFSQNVVRDNHLRGKLTGKVNFSSVWNNRLVLNKDKILIDSDITILNGELVNFEPMMGLSKFISLNELQTVKFSTLKNRIYVKDNQVVIPQMDIESSAFNISGSGTHYFDNHYNYKIKVLLSDVLARKARKAKKENSEFGVVEDDGLGRTSIYLSIVGFDTNYKITYDSRKALDVLKESFVKQKVELKQIMNSEFGWFKKDSTVIGGKKVKKSNVSVEWEDQNNSEESKNEKDVKTIDNKTKKSTTSDKLKVEWE